MSKIRIEHAGHTVEIEAADEPIKDLAALAENVWSRTGGTTPPPVRGRAGFEPPATDSPA